MASDDPLPNATQLLQRLNAGDSSAARELLPLVYDQLHALAARYMHAERASHTLQATALLNEAWMRLVDDQRDASWEGRSHFVRVAARAMRNVLVDHARAKLAEKRGGGRTAAATAAAGRRPCAAARRARARPSPSPSLHAQTHRRR